MRWLLWCFCLLAESYETINHYHYHYQIFSQGGSKVVKFCFSCSKSRKQRFFAETFKTQGALVPPLDTHVHNTTSTTNLECKNFTKTCLRFKTHRPFCCVASVWKRFWKFEYYSQTTLRYRWASGACKFKGLARPCECMQQFSLMDCHECGRILNRSGMSKWTKTGL